MKSKSIQFILIAMTLITLALQSNAVSNQPISARQTLLADFNWKFTRGDISGADQPKFDDSKWRSVDLPHDWSIEGPYSETEPTGGGGGFLPTGVGWYRRHFDGPKSWSHKKVLIEFDGIYEHSQVWLNGKLLGYRPFGYIGFEYDLTPYLKFGGENVISVRVDNSLQPNSRWYSGSGIYRHVWLKVLSQVHIAHWGTYVTTPHVSDDSATVHVATQVTNDSDTGRTVTLLTDVLDENGIVVGSTQTNEQIAPGKTNAFLQDVSVAKPSLWSLDKPTLYHLRSTVLDTNAVQDQTDTPFGIRTIAYDVDKGFLLNGVHIKMHGMCLHHDGGSVGSAVPIGVWQRRLELLKAMGCNAIRCSHNPPAPEFLDLCDRLGFLVMDESFDEWTFPKVKSGYAMVFKDWSQRDLTDMLHRDRNHPSIVIWSVGNEIGEQRSPTGADILRPLVETCQREDPTRPVTAACDNVYTDHGSATPEFLSALDVVGYNYVDRWGSRRETYYEGDRLGNPTRKFIGTEENTVPSQRGVYTFAPTGSDHLVRPNYVGAAIRTEGLLKFDTLHDYVIGEFFWTGIDYLGEARPWPRKLATSGSLDTCGFTKDSYYFFQSLWTTAPMVHLLPHWNWAGKEGQVIPIVCYTNCSTVELFINGKSFGAKSIEFPRQGTSGGWNSYATPPIIGSTSDLHLSWDVPYEPGTIEAVGYRNGGKVADDQIKTAGPAASVVLTVDKTNLDSTGQDVAHITATVVDSNGVMVPDAGNLISFDIQGAGHLIGVDNGDPASHEDYKANVRHAYNGLCLAILESNRKPGAIKVTVSADGLKGSSVEVMSHAPAQVIAVLP